MNWPAIAANDPDGDGKPGVTPVTPPAKAPGTGSGTGSTGTGTGGTSSK